VSFAAGDSVKKNKLTRNLPPFANANLSDAVPWDCLAHVFLYYGSRKDVSNSIGTINNSNFTYHFTNL
jgi:hypothetical protein